MKLNEITVEAYQKISNINIALRAPVLFVAGANEAGKTSLADAIRHAIIGEPGRVKLKKDFGELVNDEFKKGVVSIEWARNGEVGCSSVVIPAGTRTSDIEPTPAIHCLLDFRKFTSMTPNERRNLLFGLAKIRVTGAVIREKLLEAGANPEKVESIAPILLAGFEAAEKEAKAKVSEARGSWKATAGEVYGAVKAESWKAEAPAWDQAKLDESETLVSMAGDLLTQANTSMGALQEQKRQSDAAGATLLALREKAGFIERLKAKLATDEAALAEWTQKVNETTELASGAKLAATLDCPHCEGVVVLEKGKLVAYEAPAAMADPVALEALPEYIKSLARVQGWVDNDRRDIAAAQHAQTTLSEMEANPIAVISEDAIDTARKALKLMVDSQVAARKKLDAELHDKDKATQAAASTAKAAGYHADVKEWDAIASLLAPSGIQSQMMTQAMTPIRERLQATATATGWQLVTIDDDMAVRIGGRAYALGSQSAKWRADVELTEAISFLSGERMMLIDEVDVLDGMNRLIFLKWMHALATKNQIDMAVILGTFKECPQCPPTFQTEWIENGALRVALRAAA